MLVLEGENMIEILKQCVYLCLSSARLYLLDLGEGENRIELLETVSFL